MAEAMKPIRGMHLREAWWFDADQPNAWKHARTQIMKRFLEIAVDYNVVLGSIDWMEATPESSLLPPPPKTFQGNIKAMIGTVKVVEEGCQIVENRLTEELPEEQLIQMRNATRKAWRRAGGATQLSDSDCDLWINREGPEAAIPETMH